LEPGFSKIDLPDVFNSQMTARLEVGGGKRIKPIFESFPEGQRPRTRGINLGSKRLVQN